jgi:NAD(P)-dependent dehydrogenase (short-subunit alcohol dehydrogenase family)
VSSMDSVRQFAAEYATGAGTPIDALICNAGVSHGPAATVDGVDGVFATNHLGHFLLTGLLLERMSPSGRVISVSSDMHQPPGPKLKWPGAEALARPGSRALGGSRYSYSKLCNLYFVYELSRRLSADASPITAAAFNPGLMTETSFVSMPRAVAAVMKRIFASRVGSLEGSSAALASLAASVEDVGGHYYDRTTRPSRSSQLSYDIPNARELWQVSSRLTGIAA